MYDEPAGSAASTSRHAYPPTNDAADGVDEALLPGATQRRHSGTGGLGTGAVGLYYLRQVRTPAFSSSLASLRSARRLSLSPSRSFPSPSHYSTTSPQLSSSSSPASSASDPQQPRSDRATRSRAQVDLERRSRPPRRQNSGSSQSSGQRDSRDGAGRTTRLPLRAYKSVLRPASPAARLSRRRALVRAFLPSSSAATTRLSASRATRCAS